MFTWSVRPLVQLRAEDARDVFMELSESCFPSLAEALNTYADVDITSFALPPLFRATWIWTVQTKARASGR